MCCSQRVIFLRSDYLFCISCLKEPKKRDFDRRGSPSHCLESESKKVDFVVLQKQNKEKQHKNTSKHERYENSSLIIDIPDDEEDAFFERTRRRTTERKSDDDEFDESVHELFFFGVKKDDDED